MWTSGQRGYIEQREKKSEVWKENILKEGVVTLIPNSFPTRPQTCTTGHEKSFVILNLTFLGHWRFKIRASL